MKKLIIASIMMFSFCALFAQHNCPNRKTDNIERPFVTDNAVIGAWQSVDFVEKPEVFSPGVTKWKGGLFLDGITFNKDGKTDKKTPGFTWTKGYVLHLGDRTASAYEIKNINGKEYMFMEWKSGDYTCRGMTPWYYVLEKI